MLPTLSSSFLLLYPSFDSLKFTSFFTQISSKRLNLNIIIMMLLLQM